MSSTRNKRKRPDNDPSAMASASRRRSRETRAPSAAAPSTDPTKETAEENIQNGEPSTKPLPKTAQSPLPESESESESKSKPDKPGDATNANADADATTETSSKSSGKKSSGKTQTGKNVTESSAEESGSSQAESTTPKQPLHITETSENDSKTKEDTKKEGTDRDAKVHVQVQVHVRGLIRHRSILLERIRLCRSAVERRLGEKDYSFVGNVSGNGNGNGNGKGIGLQDMTDDKEISAYRDLTRKASQAAKKSKSEADVTAEKRTSLSLRRGSSVGKRMNAALSSLAPGSNATTATTATSEGPTIALSLSVSVSLSLSHQVSVAPGKIVSKPPQAQGGLPKSSSKSAFQAVPTDKQKQILVPPPAVVRPPPPPPSVNKPSSSYSSSILPPTTKQTLLSDITAKSRVPNTKGIKSIARQSSVPSVPLQSAASSSALPTNRLAPQKVHFPLAVGLRAKREMIQSKLNPLLEPKRKDLPRGKASNKKKKSIPPMNPPIAVPPRRKTHWDSVLEEIGWMATDFTEERKWKISAARTIASSIPGPGMSVVSPPACRNLKTRQDAFEKVMETGNPEKECTVETLDEAMSAEETAAAKPVETSKQPSSNEKMKQPKVDAKDYAKPSSEDVKSAKQFGKVISTMIFELGEATMDSGSFKDTDELSNKALDRFLESRSRILDKEVDAGSAMKEGKIENGDKAVNGDAGEIAGEKPEAFESEETREQAEEMPFERITEYVDSLGKSSGKTRGKVSVKEMANAMKAEKFQFGGEQKHALEFVDRLWGSKPCIGGVLEGPPASGKTIATCTLLWKHRFKGPQLIVCSPTSVVSGLDAGVADSFLLWSLNNIAAALEV
jgi:hypothetical protein